jgi:hypothetical protein
MAGFLTGNRDLSITSLPRPPLAFSDFAEPSARYSGPADVTEAMNTPGYMVFTLLAYLAWKTKSSTFVLSNDCLKRYGVDRDAKRRALARLEKAGVIRIERHGRHAPKVTLLIEPASRV